MKTCFHGDFFLFYDLNRINISIKVKNKIEDMNEINSID